MHDPILVDTDSIMTAFDRKAKVCSRRSLLATPLVLIPLFQGPQDVAWAEPGKAVLDTFTPVGSSRGLDNTPSTQMHAAW
jgi:hypothetical protein